MGDVTPERGHTMAPIEREDVNRHDLVCDIVPMPARELDDLRQERDDLRHALQWAMSNVDDPAPESGEYAEDHGGATRLAWPDEPENWS